VNGVPFRAVHDDPVSVNRAIDLRLLKHDGAIKQGSADVPVGRLQLLGAQANPAGVSELSGVRLDVPTDDCAIHRAAALDDAARQHQAAFDAGVVEVDALVELARQKE